MASRLSQLAPIPPKAEMGLFELLMNAIEHGNLEIGSEQKRKLLAEDQLADEIETRLSRVGLGARRVTVDVSRTDDAILYTIADEGGGFDWQRYTEVDPDSPLNDGELGRGILLAREIGFDSLAYQGNGNTVVASIKLS